MGKRVGALAACVLLTAGGAMAQARPDGTVAMPASDLPWSVYASDEAKAVFIGDVAAPGFDWGGDVAKARAHYDQINSDRARRMRAIYAVDITPKTVAGVKAELIAPKGGPGAANSKRILINLHGGAFLWGAGSGGQVESIPVAAVSGIPVLSLDYRMAPEHRFPAASQDVEAVYRELLKTYPAANIGIYGCSAGAVVAGEAVAWIAAKGLPRPGALGTFCASVADIMGDSSYLAQLADGQPPQVGVRTVTTRSYFEGADVASPLVMPARSPDVLAKFPPTLLITGTRDFSLSGVSQAHRELTKAGVEADLHVWDGMWHSFFSDPEIPESKEAYAVMARFFDRHLGR